MKAWVALAGISWKMERSVASWETIAEVLFAS